VTVNGERLRGLGWCAAAAIACTTALCSARCPAAAICFEAEFANRLTFPFEITRATGASNHLALCAPEGAGCHYAFQDDTGTATYHVPVPTPGRYALWLRVWWNGKCSNSICLSIPNIADRRVASDSYGRWHWLSAGRWKLPKGTVALSLLNREDGAWVDQLLLTSDTKAPAPGPHKTTLIPGTPGAEPPDPLLFFAATKGGVSYDNKDYSISHGGSTGKALDRLHRCVLRRGRPTRLVLWLRNNALTAPAGVVALKAPKGVIVKPAAEQPFHFQKGVPLKKIEFKLAADKGLARRTFPASVFVRHNSGRVAARGLRLIRPFQWLVTDPMPCPADSGLDTPSAVEANRARGVPGQTAGITWKLAPETAFTPFGLLNMRKASADRTDVMAYAYTCVTSGEGGKHLLSVRHDDMIRVWLNGRKVFESTWLAPSVITRSLTPVTLKAGENHLLVKICQRKNYWEFLLEILSPARKPTAVTGRQVAPLLEPLKRPR